MIEEIARDERMLNDANIHYLPIAIFNFLLFLKKKKSNQASVKSPFRGTSTGAAPLLGRHYFAPELIDLNASEITGTHQEKDRIVWVYRQ